MPGEGAALSLNLAPLPTPISRLPCGEKIDFDERAAGEGGNADAGSRRQPSRGKIGLIDGVHRRVIPLELGQVNASEYDLVEGATGAGEDAPQIFDEPGGSALRSLEVMERCRLRDRSASGRSRTASHRPRWHG